MFIMNNNVCKLYHVFSMCVADVLLCGGPAYDVALFRKFLKAHKIPPRLPIICLSALQVYCVQ